MAVCGLEQPWTLTNDISGAVHTFVYNPTILPTFEYERPMTEHRLISGSVKFDVEEYKVKTLILRWEDNVFFPRSEREALEALLVENTTFTLMWIDEDGTIHQDMGYLIADRSSGVYKVGYTFEIRLKLTAVPKPKLWSKLESAEDATSPEIGVAGSVVGAVSWLPCKFGNGVYSDANNEYVSFPRAANSIDLAKGTIECWMKLNFLPTDPNRHYIWTFEAPGWDFSGVYTLFDPTANQIRACVVEHGVFKIKLFLSWSWEIGTLAHYAVVWDKDGSNIGAGKTLLVKINNVEIGSSTITWGTTGTQGSDLRVGISREVPPIDPSKIVIDNLKTYNVCKINFSDKDIEAGYA